MSLKSFHVLLITLSSLLAFGFGGWSIQRWSTEGDWLSLAMGAFSILGGLGLIAYVLWFRRKVTTPEEDERRRRRLLRKVPVAIIVWLVGQDVSNACSVCYGDAGGPLIDAARLGVFLLFGLVFAVQLAFAAFFFNLWRRARQIRQDEARP
jgi:hypothetical protein